MYRTGALVVSSGKVLLPALSAASRLVAEVLYVPLASAVQPVDSDKDLRTQHEVWNIYETLQQIKNIYFLASRQCPLLDVRVLLPNLTSSASAQDNLDSGSSLEHGDLDILVSSVPSLEEVQRLPGYMLLSPRLKFKKKMEYMVLQDIQNNIPTSQEFPAHLNAQPQNEVQFYDNVALGGTFDNLHHGHRLLLAQSAFLAQRRLVVGVSDGPLIANKVLTELIKPVKTRLQCVRSFLSDVKPGLTLEVVPIEDVYGPAGTDKDLDALVVSHETARGGEIINTERNKKGLNPLSVYVVDLLDRSVDTSLAQEQKLSSSDIRRNMLGSYRKAEVCTCLKSYDSSSGPYLVGLTGGIATGKSSIVKRLTAMGACAIDCDKLGHEAYQPGTKAYSDIVAEFGAEVVAEDGTINRRVLGPLVFGNKENRLKLNQIVWPEIWRLVEARIADAHASGYAVCVVDAAVLLQAGWQDKVHEVWVTIAPVKEVIKRVMERDGVSEEAAHERLAAQITNAERVQYANVIFSSQWEPEYTQKQVAKAWKELQERISEHKCSSKI